MELEKATFSNRVYHIFYQKILITPSLQDSTNNLRGNEHISHAYTKCLLSFGFLPICNSSTLWFVKPSSDHSYGIDDATQSFESGMLIKVITARNYIAFSK
jgi:hypothetical protein